MDRRLLPALALCLLLGGCAVGHDRRWERATFDPAATLEGRWEGTWDSETTGQQGPLRCLVTHLEEDRYDFHFRVAWKFLSLAWRLEIQARNEGRAILLQGKRDIGFFLGGEYTFEGTVEGSRMSARYQSSKERGTFALERAP